MFHCRTQDEKEVLNSFKQHLSKEAVRNVFILTCDRMYRYEGAWHVESRPIFPNCIFLESNKEKQLSEEINKYYSNLNEKIRIEKIGASQEYFLKSLCDRNYHTKLSKGYIFNGRTYITEGPLFGKEEVIKKIDRHKRIAKIEIPSQLKHWSIYIGLEIVAKS